MGYFLLNPNGILFGAGAQVNVGGLVASTLNLTDGDFIAGRLKFGPTPGAGNVVNRRRDQHGSRRAGLSDRAQTCRTTGSSPRRRAK